MKFPRQGFRNFLHVSFLIWFVDSQQKSEKYSGNLFND